MSNIKDFLYVIKSDLKQLRKYPEIQAGKDFHIDYEKYWNKRRGNVSKPALSLWEKERADNVLDIITKGSKVMDLGCGDGAILLYFKDKKNIKGYGVDFHQKSVNALKKEGLDGEVCDITDLEQVKKLPEADYITGFEIIEHIPNPEELICTLLPKAKKGLIFSFPNTGYYAHRLRLLFGKFPLQWVVHPGEHVRFWTVSDVKWWVKNIGLKLDKLIIYQGVPGFKKIFPSLFGAGIIIVIHSED